MRKLVTLVALATALASPAFAQSYDPDIGSGNIAPAYGQTTGWNTGAAGAYALAVPGAAHARSAVPSAAQDPYVVTLGSKVLGRDPDPFIRSQLLRIRGGNHPG
jgi:hypothetical protein